MAKVSPGYSIWGSESAFSLFNLKRLNYCAVCMHLDPDLMRERCTRKCPMIIPQHWLRFSADDFNRDFFKIDTSVRDLQHKSAQGCQACSMLICCLTHFDPLIVEDVHFKLSLYVLPGLDVYVVGRKIQRTKSFDMRLFCKPEQSVPWPILCTERKPISEALTDDRLSLVTGWIDGCLSTHSHCAKESSEGFPRRLVDVGSPDGERGPVLVDGLTEHPPYVALSHCWEASQPPKLTNSNLTLMKAEIPWSVLSPTIQDAIRITRWLGIRYVWIDSLCILQDDEKDWHSQASQMAHIYGGSYVTIAAHFGPHLGSKAGGCNLQRDDYETIEVECCKDEKTFTVQMQRKSPQTIDVAHTSLMRRAWCFQERRLAPRVLHFHKHEIEFECSSGTQCECRFHEKPRMSSKVAFGFLYREEHIDSNSTHLRKRSVSKPWNIWDFWHEQITAYTSAHLSFVTDILPALSGIAHRMPRQIFGDYLAGLWTGSLLTELCWYHRESTNRYRYQEYVAPTFSWAASSGSCEWPEMKEFLSLSDCAKILAAEVTHKGGDKMGQVAEGFIHLFGRSARARLKSRAQTPEDEPYRAVLSQAYFPEAWYTAVVYPDTEEDALYAADYEFTLVEIIKPEKYGKHGIGKALVLKLCTSSGMKYERIGLAEVSGNFFRQNQVEEVVIL